MARKRREEEHINQERWLVSYADFITLLFAFFVVMYAISSVNEGKYRVLSDSLMGAFSTRERSLAPIQVGKLVRSPYIAESAPGLTSVAANFGTPGETPDGPVAEAPATGSARTSGAPDESALDLQGKDAAMADIKTLAKKTNRSFLSQIDKDLVEVRVEEDWIDHDAARLILESYLNPLVDKGIDALLLACTHYPLLIPVLEKLLPADVTLVDSASTCAQFLKRELEALELLNEAGSDGSLEIHLTDLSEEFEALASRFLTKAPGRIRRA